MAGKFAVRCDKPPIYSPPVHIRACFRTGSPWFPDRVPGCRAWGADLTTERSPLEAGLGYLVKTEGRDFIGRDAMLGRAQTGEQWSMQLLEFEDPEFDPFYLHPVFRDKEPVGMITSGCYGHRMQKAIALACFRKPVTNEDELRVEILGRNCQSRITRPL